jgi:hypothetical protein
MGLLQPKTRLATIWEEREPYGDYYKAPEMNDFYHENHKRLPSEIMNRIARHVPGSRRYVSSHLHDTRQRKLIRENGEYMRLNGSYNERHLATRRKQIAYQHELLQSALEHKNNFNVQHHLGEIQWLENDAQYYANKVAEKNRKLMRALR